MAAGTDDPQDPSRRQWPQPTLELPPDDRDPSVEDTLPSAWARPAGDGAGAPPPTTDSPPPDYRDLLTVPAEHYVLTDEVARGGMGRIRVARDRRLGREVALKEILVDDRALARRFEREARITARLQHPSIVSVYEAGRWPSGEPFYAMPLVDGRSLDKVIASTRSFDERLALLPNVLAVADAIAYAHEQRVIHRDLKPHNVLVGRFGETVVIDWGLVKDLAAADATPDNESTPPRPAGGDSPTVAGDVFGTPTYMPPEQAAGHPVDERADVYAIGAILAHVLAGRPPYAGSDDRAILRAVREGPPPPLRAHQPEVPEDLLAIVDRAMAREPAARYPTARELAEDLRRFHTGQLVAAHRYSLRQLVARWIRRQRAAVAVAGVAAAILAAVAAVGVVRVLREQRRVEEQRQRAELHRAEAEELTDFMLFDLRDKLQAVGRLELLDEVASKAVGYYAQRVGGDRARRRKRAAALSNLGDTLEQRGKLSEALAQQRAAYAHRAELLAADPGDLSLQRDLADSQGKIGAVLFGQGNLPEALQLHQTARATLRRLLDRDPGSNETKLALAGALSAVGDDLAAQGDGSTALEHYREAMALASRVIEEAPDDLDAHDALARCHDRIGTALLARGDPAGALVEFRAQTSLRQRHADADPTNAALQAELPIAHIRVGDALVDLGDLAGGLAAYREASAVSLQLAALDPGNADWQRNLAVSHNRAGKILQQQGDARAALEAYRSALAIEERLAARDRTNSRLQSDVGTSHMRLGDALAAQGRAADALVEYRAAEQVAEELAARDPTNAEWQRVLSFSHYNLGDALLADGQLEDALAEHRAGLAIAARLAARDPDNAEWQRDLWDAGQRVGDVLRARGEAAAALIAYREALAVAERLIRRNPANADWQRDRDQLRAIIDRCCGTAPRTPTAPE